MTTTTEELAAHQLLIGGERLPGADGRTIDVTDPSTGSTFATVASAGVDDGLRAVDAAADAQAPWARTAPRERSEILRRAFDLMTQRAESFAQLIVRENGKTLADARAEVSYAAEFFRWYAEEAVRIEGSVATAPNGGNRILVTHQPIGVSLLVTPWNFPAAMATRKLAPALAAGCAAILKPASDTPLTALAIGDLLEEAGVPGGVVNVVPARGSDGTIEAMLRCDVVRKLSFTGSTEVGRTLLTQAADSVTDCSMELGGNAPFLVFADADLDDAITGALLAKMRNDGQACTAANRFYVADAVADEFVERLSDAMREMRVGPGLDPDSDVGPLINDAARNDVGSLVTAAVREGAALCTGGASADRPGSFYQPTVLDHVAVDSPLLGQEIFGPVAPVVRFTDEEEAIRRANAVEHGLVAYLYVGDLRRGLGVAEQLDTGMVGLNRGLVSDPAAPFGGVKQSGLGREGGHHGLLEFTESKYVALEW